MLSIIGIGVGNPLGMTLEAIECVKNCDVLIGSHRQLENIQSLCQPHQKTFSYVKLDALKAILCDLLSNSDTFKIGLLASGDPLFYGITPWIKREFQEEEMEIIGGLSSLQVLFNRCEIPMHNVYLTSAHGRDFNVSPLLELPLIGILTDAKWTPFALAQIYVKKDLNPQFIIGENLGQIDEKITTTDAKSVQNINYKMNVVIIKK